MIGLTYISILVLSLLGFAIIDHKFKLVFWKNPKWAAIVVSIGVLFFSIWDVVGIFMNIFFTGSTKFLTGLMLSPDFPVEELFFLTLLCYQTLIFWELLKRSGVNV